MRKFRTPSIKSAASDQARRVHAFIVAKGWSMRSWTTKAGVSNSVLTELFSGETQSLTVATLTKLALAAECSPLDIVGEEAYRSMEGEQEVTLKEVGAAVAVWATGRQIDDPLLAANEVVSIILDARSQV